jgi:hypothetical protein
MIGWTNMSLDDTVEIKVRQNTDHPFVLYLGGTSMMTGTAVMLTKEVFESLVFQCHAALNEYDNLVTDEES